MNLEDRNRKRRESRQLNLDNRRKYDREYSYKKRRTDSNYRIMGNLRNRIRLAIKNNQKNGSTLDLIDCDINFLKKHLESQFSPEMNWSNYGSYWSIDHYIGCCTFDLSLEENQKECFNWKNLRPLTIVEKAI